MSLSSVVTAHKKLLGTNFVVIGPSTSPSAVGAYNASTGELMFNQNVILLGDHSFTSTVKSLTPASNGLNLVISSKNDMTIPYTLGAPNKFWGELAFG